MTLRLAASLSLALLACARPGPPPASPAAARPVASAPKAAPQPVAPAPACDYPAEQQTTPAGPVAPPEDAVCRAPPPRVKRALWAAVRKQWQRTWPKGWLEIRDGCDRLDPQIDSLVLESSSGHGGSLTLVGLERRQDGDYDLVLLEYDHYQRTQPAVAGDPYQEDSAGPLQVFKGQVKAATMTPLLDRVRAAAHVEAVEHEPPPSPGLMYGASGSSQDLHLALRLNDARGHGVQRWFAGYVGSGEQQKDSVPLAIVRTTIDELLTDDFRATLTPAGADDPDARALYAAVFAQARTRGEDFGYWYVGERMLGLAASLGSPQQVPALLDHLRPPAPDGEKVSHARRTVLALNAIAAIVAYDRRYEVDGKSPRKVDEVAAETLAACTRPGG